jgi:very-short-patch-repair endonuclease
MVPQRSDVFGMPLDARVSYRQLRRSGMSRHAIDDALRSGALIRARRDVYLSAEVPDAVIRAQRVGGRLDCLSVLQAAGIFVLENSRVHVQVEPHHSRLRSSHSRTIPLTVRRNGDVIVHWRELDAAGDLHSVSVLDALVQSARCQSPRAFIASLDSALNLGWIGRSHLDEIFALLPSRFGVLMPLIDGRAEAGSETLARLLVRGMGRVEVQKVIYGVGRVDLVIDGWIAVECDSREFHAGWAAQERDRARDLALAALGYTSLRPTAALIFTQPEVFVAAVRGLLDTRH